MSDNLMRQNRLIMRNSYRVKVGTGIENHYCMSYLSATLQALFACEEFRVKIILFAEEYKPQGIRIHTHIADLYKHMVIGKEAFVILALNVLSTQLTPQLIEWEEVNPKYFIENLLESLDSLYHDYKNTPQTQATLDKCPTESFIGQKVFRDQIYWTTTIDSGGKVRVGEQPPQSLIEDEVNRQCGSDSAISVWQLPSILILALEPEKNDIAIQYTIIVDSQKYSLFAYVCKQRITEVEHYDCCTKFDEQWTYFDGKIAEEITKPVINLENVCLMFYERNETADITQCSEYRIVDRLIGSFENVPQIANLIQPQPMYRPMRQTTEQFLTIAFFKWRLGLRNEAFLKICYMNTTVQSLYACRLIRKYLMECDQNIGPFHRVFKHLFLSMKVKHFDNVLHFHTQLYHLYEDIHIFNMAYHCFMAILIQLHRECINFGSNEDIAVANRETIADVTNYAHIYGGREDLTSISSWNRHVIAEHNSYITNLFTKQRISCERCKFGHKTRIQFVYQYYHFVPRFVHEYAKSLQKIVYLLSTCEDRTPRMCDICQSDSSELYLYSKSMSRASDILVFHFEFPPSEPIEAWQSFGRTGVHLNEHLVVCGQTYRCMAWTVFVRGEYRKLGHIYAYCRSDDGFWYILNDAYVTKLYFMPQEKSIIEPKARLDMAFYERVFDAKQTDSDSDSKESILKRLRSRSDLTKVEKEEQSRPRSGSQLIDDQAIRQSIVGFTNSTGFRSYVNSVIQCLYHCSKFRNYIMHEQRAIDVLLEDASIGYTRYSTHHLLKRLFDSMFFRNWQTIDAIDTWFFYHFNAKKNVLPSSVPTDAELDPKDFLWQIITDLSGEDNGLQHADSRSGVERERILNDLRNKEITVLWTEYLRNSHVVEMFYVITQYNMFCSQTETHNKMSSYSDIKLEIPIKNPNAPQINSVRSLVNGYLLHSKLETIYCDDCNQANPNPNPNGNANLAQMVTIILRTPDILVIQFDSVEPDIWQLFMDGFHVDIDEEFMVYEQNYIFRSCICCDVSAHEYYDENAGALLYQYSYHFNVYVSVGHDVYRIDDSEELSPHPQPTTVLQQLRNVYMVFYEKI